MTLHQGIGQGTLFEQVLHAINVGHDALKQTHALKHTRLNLLPVWARQHER